MNVFIFQGNEYICHMSLSGLKPCILFILMCLLSVQNNAQTAEKPRYTLYMGVKADYGFLWAHRPTMSHLVNQHILAGEISIWKATNGEKCWHEPYHRPQTGITLAAFPLGDERLGTAIGLYPYVNFPLLPPAPRSSLNIQLGWGLGWITNKFDPITNHKNTAIGSHLNACIHLRGLAMFRLSKNVYLETGIGLTHFSNGAFSLPNLGINIPSVNLGLHYRISGDPESPCVTRTDKKYLYTDSLIRDTHWHFTVMMTGGANDIAPDPGPRYPLCNVLMTMMKNTSRKHRFGGGIDVMYSKSLLVRMRNDEQDVTPVENVQLGAKFSYELVLGRLYLPFEMGVYAYSKFKEHGMIYHRLAVRYLITDHFVCGVSLKTHFSRAEYWEVGIGWRL